jgi:ParB-like chromosome segregation protein Spo0J
MKFHPLANAFPLLEGEEFDRLVESVRKHGQLESVVTYENMILDGRNRARACKAAGIEPVGEAFEGGYEEARDFVIAANITRRHLDVSQRALIAARLATMRPGDNQHSVGEANSPSLSQAKAAERLNVSERSVRDAHRVVERGAPEVVRAVERGEVAVSRAARVVGLPKDEQAARLAESRRDLASPANLPSGGAIAHPLRNLVNISGGEFAAWIKATTPKDRAHVIRVLEMAAAILRDEMRGEEAA